MMSELVDKKNRIQIFVLQPFKFQNNLEMAEEAKKNSCLYDYMVHYDNGHFYVKTNLKEQIMPM